MRVTIGQGIVFGAVGGFCCDRMHGFLEEISVKNSLLCVTSLTSVTITPSVAVRPSSVAAFTMRPMAARAIAAASMASILSGGGDISRRSGDLFI